MLSHSNNINNAFEHYSTLSSSEAQSLQMDHFDMSLYTVVKSTPHLMLQIKQ